MRDLLAELRRFLDPDAPKVAAEGLPRGDVPDDPTEKPGAIEEGRADVLAELFRYVRGLPARVTAVPSTRLIIGRMEIPYTRLEPIQIIGFQPDRMRIHLQCVPHSTGVQATAPLRVSDTREGLEAGQYWMLYPLLISDGGVGFVSAPNRLTLETQAPIWVRGVPNGEPGDTAVEWIIEYGETGEEE